MKKRTVFGLFCTLGIAVFFGYGIQTGRFEQIFGLSTQKSVRDLFLSGSSQKCILSTDPNKSVIYFAGGKLRGDFLEDEGESKTHLVISDSAVYSWKEGEKVGFKSLLQGGGVPETGQVFGVDINKTSEYECDSWISSESTFSLPKGVTFTDFVETFGQTPATSSGTESQCKVCDSLEGEEQEQCRSVLNCN